ncbi:phosphatidylglycerophosphatase A [Mariprofundus erugo]|uniref:Phosphatidylglycerophosphatase A n=1 Tax=Mariprofundus erugo TaxID=2528639 RepID=A0A5R9GUX2_9PROT|nr:phosphatidylglycerophosphatase A [Mariprofundus erugo]TLS67987.1 phosphatidylglycerophosphatase A [Mariprofundus erugo]
MITLVKSYGFSGWIAAGFGSGWLPKAPGTWGSLAALPPAWLLLDWFGVAGLFWAAILILGLGCGVCAIVLPQLEDQDPGWIVIDEWAGQWLCIAMVAAITGISWVILLPSFIAFRLFDIFKPWPVSWAERVGPAWWSIMADDMVAGALGGGLLFVAAYFAGVGGR